MSSKIQSLGIKNRNIYIRKKHSLNILNENKPQEMNVNTKMKLYHSKEIKHLCFQPELMISIVEEKKLNTFSNIPRSFYKFPKNSDDNLSRATTNLCDNKKDNKVKKVTFSTIEIIRIVKYKKYNLATTFPKSFIKKNFENFQASKRYKGSMCIIF